jgi:bacterial/archaeal transporter family protein
MWMPLTCISALLLGCYDISKKKAVEGNAVLPTLFFSTLAAALAMAPILLLSALDPGRAESWHLAIPPQPPAAHGLILLKSILVGCSWMLSYMALKHLPITVATPLRATGPLFTVIGAVAAFGERPTASQWAGIALILAAYLAYSAGARKGTRKEGSTWPYILMMIGAAITGAVSAGFDKYLLQTRGLPPLFVLGYFLPYLAGLLGVTLLLFRSSLRARSTPFRLRPAMAWVGVFLVAADFAYMSALSHPEARLAVVSAIRRTNVLVSFLGGAWLFREHVTATRLLPLGGILLGLVLLLL